MLDLSEKDVRGRQLTELVGLNVVPFGESDEAVQRVNTPDRVIVFTVLQL